MAFPRIGVFAPLLLLAACTSVPVKTVPVAERLAQGAPVVVAHRGCWYWQKAPENSLLALEHCARNHIDMAELDVRATQDGVLVLMHDATLERTTNLSGALREYRYAALWRARLKAGLGDAEPLTYEPVPTLAEVLRVAKRRGLMLALHVMEPELQDAVYAEVADAQAQDLVLMKMQMGPYSPQLRQAAFYGHVAFMPILHQCEPLSGPLCSRHLGHSMEAYRMARPVLYEVSYHDDRFLATRKKGAQWPGLWVNAIEPGLVAGRDEQAVLKDWAAADATWGWMLDNGAQALLTNHPMRLKKYLQWRQQGAMTH